MKQEEDCPYRRQTENEPFQRTFLRRSHAEKMGKPQRTCCPSHPSPPAPETQEQRRVGAANQPHSLEAEEWEGNNLVRATEGVKAMGAFRSGEQLGC